MASQPVAARRIFAGRTSLRRPSVFSSQSQAQCICRRSNARQFSSSNTRRQQNDYKESFGKRLRKALGETKIKWYPIPVGLGIAFLGLVQLNRINEREKKRKLEEEWEDDAWASIRGNYRNDGEYGRPKRRERIRPTGPWYAPILSE